MEKYVVTRDVDMLAPKWLAVRIKLYICKIFVP